MSPSFLFKFCVVCFEVAIGDVFCLLTERWSTRYCAMDATTLVQTASLRARAGWPGQLLQMGLVDSLAVRPRGKSTRPSPGCAMFTLLVLPHCPFLLSACRCNSSEPDHVGRPALFDFPRRSPENGTRPGTRQKLDSITGTSSFIASFSLRTLTCPSVGMSLEGDPSKAFVRN